jgi:hypothetical protein
MTLDDLNFIKYKTLDCKRFSHWVWLQDRSSGINSKKKKRKKLRSFIESIIDKLSGRWQYQECDNNVYIIKLDNEKDLLVFLLKFKKN